MSSDYPSNLRYSKEHEWVRVTGNVARIGVTAFAVEQLGDVTMVELPDEGDPLEKDQVFGTVESVKAVSDLFAPVSGQVARINTPLTDSPEYVNEDPYDEGWMIEIEMSDPAQVEELMNAEAYVTFIADDDA